ncbi:MAG: hypothetical protein OXF79_28725, partial [Chloroflexi bacterium]|nr:hypothetical protein [Chloroflexota bacterium]
MAFGNSAAGTAKYTASVAENVSGGTLEVPVTVSHLPGSPTTFEIEVLATGTAVEGADYRIGTKSVTFGPDDTTRTQNLTVTIVDDTDVEPGETIELRIAAADDPVDDLGDYYARGRNGSRATLTVTNDDIPLPGFDPDGSVTITDADTDITLAFAVPVKKDADGGDFSNADLANVLTLRTTDASGTALPFTATINPARTAITIDPTSALPDGAVYVAISNGYHDAVGNRGRAASVTFTVDSAAQSTDARLKALTGSTSTDGSDFSGTLDIGAFAVDDTAYAATVENAVTHVKLTPTANEAYATVRVGRRGSLAAVDSGEASGAIALEAG